LAFSGKKLIKWFAKDYWSIFCAAMRAIAAAAARSLRSSLVSGWWTTLSEERTWVIDGNWSGDGGIGVAGRAVGGGGDGW